MHTKDKRSEIRIPLLSEVAYIDDKEVAISDISTQGTFVKIGDFKFPKIHSTLNIDFKLPGELGRITIPAEVSRISWAKTQKYKVELGYGLKFLEMPENIQKILSAYTVYLRNKQIITVSKRIIEEFFGHDKPRSY